MLGVDSTGLKNYGEWVFALWCPKKLEKCAQPPHPPSPPVMEVLVPIEPTVEGDDAVAYFTRRERTYI